MLHDVSLDESDSDVNIKCSKKTKIKKFTTKRGKKKENK